MRTIVEEFDSPQALTRHLEAHKARWEWMNHVERYPSFSQCASVERALEMLAEGWPEQAAKMAQLNDQIFANLTRGVERYDPVYVECDGQTLDIPAYLTGEPEHWVQFQPSIVEGQSNRIIRIGINILVHVETSHQAIIQRGTVVSALVDALEYRGFRCEVWILCKITTHSSKLAYRWNMLAKPAEQPLSLAHLLFQSAHPAMLRRIGFAMITSSPENGKFGGAKDDGIVGSVAEIEDTSDYDIYVPAIRYDSEINWSNQTQTEAWIKAQIEKIERRTT